MDGHLSPIVLEELQNAPGLAGLAIDGLLGRGLMGAVYLAQNRRSGERCAIKVMLPRVTVEADADGLFRREIEICQALRHPNVVRAYASGEASGIYFLVMEYCAQGSLDRIVQLEGPLHPDDALPMIFEVLDGLDYAHSARVRVTGPDGSKVERRGLVHRDVKPPNILLIPGRKRRSAKVADFGLAKAFDFAGLSGLTMSGTAAGSPAFMPRQQVLNFRYATPEVDTWAAAASLYFALTGHSPRDFRPGRDRWRTVWETAPVPIKSRGVEVPDALAQAIDEALIDNPEIRVKTIHALKESLVATLPRAV